MSIDEGKDKNLVPICTMDELPVSARMLVDLGHKTIVLANIEGEIFGFSSICSHDECDLSEGNVEGFEIVCPCHGARFDIRTGKALRLPAVKAIQSYELVIIGNMINILLE
ncbi:MAG: non-heme iron oxygenase ferredoxin subunit [Anaerolineaceae bacterium]|nr:non-heme iron oxygenase ferredoxin subunit [Anaerolineaceae bacterium]